MNINIANIYISLYLSQALVTFFQKTFLIFLFWIYPKDGKSKLQISFCLKLLATSYNFANQQLLDSSYEMPGNFRAKSKRVILVNFKPASGTFFSSCDSDNLGFLLSQIKALKFVFDSFNKILTL